MIKVICTKSSGVSLTTNKVYETELAELTELGEFYTIRNDEGYLIEYSACRFIPLAELREQQIKTVLDD